MGDVVEFPNPRRPKTMLERRAAQQRREQREISAALNSLRPSASRPGAVPMKPRAHEDTTG
jgi:hypothetical protein